MFKNFEECIVCGGNNWIKFDGVGGRRSVRSDGLILNSPLEKIQCSKCALVRSKKIPDPDSLQDLYRDSYDLYGGRPESERFVSGRYRALAETITAAVGLVSPRKCLDVGCGNGATLRAVQSAWPEMDCTGLDPNMRAVEIARSNGLKVFQGMVGVELPAEIENEKYDLIFSVHVIEHTLHPVSYLSSLKKMLSREGRLVITCPNALIPNLEIMRPDHLYSMTPHHLVSIAKSAGLIPLSVSDCPGADAGLDYKYNQMLVCAASESDAFGELFRFRSDHTIIAKSKDLFKERENYIHAFEKLDKFFESRISGSDSLYCFGTGGWASMLAGYAPNTWNQIRGCLVDGGSACLFKNKKIFSYEEAKKLSIDACIAAVNPVVQAAIAERLVRDGLTPLRWDCLIPR